jgi:hypothetical protein
MITCSKVRSVARMSICTPGEAQRNPGTIARLATPTPDFTSFIRATKGKGGGTPADAYLQPPRPHLHPPPRAGEDRGGGAARVHADKCTQVCAHKIHATRRLSAFHRGACCSEPTPQLSSGRASWDAEFPVPVQRAPRRPVIVPAGALLRSRPGAPVTSPRPREPPPLRRPVSPADVLRKPGFGADGNVNGDECQ